MKSIEERLIASDAAPAGSYAPVDYSAMIDRVVATPFFKPASTLRTFKLRMAGSVAAAGLLTVLGITAIDTVGSSLPVLGFAAANAHSTSGKSATATSPSSMVMIPAVNYQFNGADNFSNEAGSATVYSMQVPSDGAATLQRMASILKVDVGTPATRDNGQSFTSSGPQYSGWLDEHGGYASWGINANSSQIATPASASSQASFEALAFSFAKQLGSLDVGVPAIVSPPGAPAGLPTLVTVPIMVGGVSTGLSYSFAFASDGTLTSASGQSFTLQTAASYPTISPSAGVAQISSQFGLVNSSPGWVAAGAGNATSGSATSSGPVPPPTSGSDVTTTVPLSSPGSPPVTSASGPPTVTPPGVVTSPGTSDTSPPATVAPTVVDLTGVSTRYGVFTMSDATTMLLPMYVYTGNVVGQTSYQVSFQVIAIDPSYLDLSKVQNISN
jgi:hypothetical protein